LIGVRITGAYEFTIVALMLVHPIATFVLTVLVGRKDGFLCGAFPVLAGFSGIALSSVFWDMGRGWADRIGRFTEFYSNIVFLLSLALGLLGLLVVFISRIIMPDK
jgi:hypothetical protein